MDLVAEYCMMDTKLVYMLCRMDTIRISDFWTAQIQSLDAQFPMTPVTKIWVLKRDEEGGREGEPSISTSCKKATFHHLLQDVLYKNSHEMMYHADHLAAHGLVSICSPDEKE